VTGIPALLLVALSRHFQVSRAFTASVPTTTRKSLPATPSRTTQSESLDPLLASILIREADENTSDVTAPLESLGGLLQASQGLQQWRTILLKGRLPIEEDFSNANVWPEEPLFSPLVKTMAELQLARFVKCHPETISAVLLTVLRITLEFASRTKPTLLDDEEQDEEEEYYEEDDEWYESSPEEHQKFVVEQPSQEEKAALVAEELASGLTEEWGGVIEGVHALDIVFGPDHGLLNVQNDNDDNEISEGMGFGLQNGIWKHTGWTLVPELQRELAAMPELRHLIKELGRRPMVEGSDAVHKFPPREAQPKGAVGAQFDPFLPNTVSGLTLSNSFSEMLSSEAMLLKGKQSLRRLFLAKKVESKLLSYERSGWLDTPSIPKPTRRRRRPHIRMPSAPGGPIVLCLDTSWSMSGTRERLSKAIILACVAAAHKQHRSCQVVAFSNKEGVMETGEITANANGVKRLLDFLGFSFGGGTDVTGALKHAIKALGTESMSAADVLLVSDGEIPDPPVSDEMMQDLDLLKQRTGMQIHGLLVGKKESPPLDKLCTKTHDFLVGYEEALATAGAVLRNEAARLNTTPVSSSSLSAILSGTPTVFLSHRLVGGRMYGFGRGSQEYARTRSRVFARYSSEDDEGGRVRTRKGKRNNKKNRYDDDDDGAWNTSYAFGNDDNEGDVTDIDTGSFNAKVEETVVKVREDAEMAVSNQRWSADELDKEKNAEGSCWCYRGELKTAVDLVSEGLIERDEESRLVVLGMISEEHVLLLGMPGTGKSALGRRLSTLCGGPFFQRLLTRFTTPEEIYGPLSLKALENDEYRRCTEGFLPTASVAFLDEIFKANSAILNTLLTILNERQFDNGAGGREACPIRCVVGASNEMPDSDELDALYDRFLLRKEVYPVSDDGLMKMLSMPTPGVSPCDRVDGSSPDACDAVFTDGLDNVVKALSAAANNVQMGEDVCALMRDLRTFLREDLDVDISDRRLVKASRLLKISAASNGRMSVDPIDCLLLQHVAWQLPEQQNAVCEWIWDHLTPGGDTPSAAVSQFRLLLDSIRREASLAVRKTAGDVTGAAGARDADVAVIESLRAEALRIANLLEEKARTLDRHMELLRRSMDHLWLNPDEARAAQQQLLPKAETISFEINRALTDALALTQTLSDSTAISNDARVSVIDSLWEDGADITISFTEEEMDLSMRDAKAKYDMDTFRAWKRARKKASK